MTRRNYIVDVLAVTFGIGAWVAINGLWVELPLLVQTLPEGWNLPSYMSIVTQIANLGPITYSLARLLWPSLKPVPVIYLVLSIGCLSSILLAFFWDNTSMVGGTEHSLSLLILVFFLALVDCTSSVLYIPYMAVWKNLYLPSYLIGEGLSGLLPALVALGQGVGGNSHCENETYYNKTSGETTWELVPKELDPNFSVDIFFYIIFAMMFASSLAFILLEVLPNIRGERVTSSDSIIFLTAKDSKLSHSTLNSESDSPFTPQKVFLFLLLIQAWSSMLANGFLPSIQSYSCGPYGNVAYHLAATLSALANPLAAFCTMLLPRAKTWVVAAFSLLGTVIACYIITTAVMSPSPPLMGKTSGSVLVVVSWIAFVGIITYARVEIANILRKDGASHLFWSGVVTQTGSAIGAVISFMLVNETNIFQSYNPCG